MYKKVPTKNIKSSKKHKSLSFTDLIEKCLDELKTPSEILGRKNVK